MILSCNLNIVAGSPSLVNEIKYCSFQVSWPLSTFPFLLSSLWLTSMPSRPLVFIIAACMLSHPRLLLSLSQSTIGALFIGPMHASKAASPYVRMRMRNVCLHALRKVCGISLYCVYRCCIDLPSLTLVRLQELQEQWLQCGICC